MACGDGSVKLYDMNVPEFPVMNFHEHKREAFSVAWSPVTKDTFVSSSWDGTVKLVSGNPRIRTPQHGTPYAHLHARVSQEPQADTCASLLRL